MSYAKASIKWTIHYILIILFMNSQSTAGETKNNKISKQTREIYSISYALKAKSSDNKIGAYSYLPRTSTVSWGTNAVRIDELGGVNNGSVIADFENSKSFYLDHRKRQHFDAGFWNIDSASKEIKAIMEDHYNVELTKLQDTKKILGFTTQKYKVTKSAFIDPKSEVLVWITEELKMRPSRFEFRANAKRILSPLPLLLGYPNGLILKMEIRNEEAIVSYTTKKIEFKKKANYFFKAPKNYKRPSKVQKAAYALN